MILSNSDQSVETQTIDALLHIEMNHPESFEVITRLLPGMVFKEYEPFFDIEAMGVDESFYSEVADCIEQNSSVLWEMDAPFCSHKDCL